MLVAAVLTATAAPALSQPAPYGLRLEVERAPGSSGCPDAQQAFTALLVMFPTIPVKSVSNEDAATIVAKVAIRPENDGHEAALTSSGARRGERTLVDRDAACRGLADAIAVAVALIVDPAAANASMAARTAPATIPDGTSALGSPKATPPPVGTGAPSRTAGAVAKRRTQASELRLGVEGGGLGSVGLLGNAAYGGYLGASATAWGGPSLRVRGVRLVANSAEIAQGRVFVDLWAAFIAACFRLPVGAFAVQPCLDWGAGSQRGEGRGFTLENTTVHRPFLSLGPSLTGTVAVGAGIEAGLTAGMAANLWRQEYVIPPASPEVGGGVQRQERVGGFLGIGVGTAWTFGSAGASQGPSQVASSSLP